VGFSFSVFIEGLQVFDDTANSSKSAGGEAANAQVCKTCIRGFNSRPALQILRGCNVAHACERLLFRPFLSFFMPLK
jgi:hypothetical protein